MTRLAASLEEIAQQTFPCTEPPGKISLEGSGSGTTPQLLLKRE